MGIVNSWELCDADNSKVAFKFRKCCLEVRKLMGSRSALICMAWMALGLYGIVWFVWCGQACSHNRVTPCPSPSGKKRSSVVEVSKWAVVPDKGVGRKRMAEGCQEF